jgi:hypothetical protein
MDSDSDSDGSRHHYCRDRGLHCGQTDIVIATFASAVVIGIARSAIVVATAVVVVRTAATLLAAAASATAGGLGGGSLRGAGAGSLLGLSVRGLSGVGLRSSWARTTPGKQTHKTSRTAVSKLSFTICIFIFRPPWLERDELCSRESLNPDECWNYTLLQNVRKS